MGQDDGALSQRGKKQSKGLAQKLKDHSFDVIYSSDLGRCIETTKEIKKFHPQTKVVYSKDLRETNYGEAQGRKKGTVDDLEEGSTFMTKKLKGGESLKDVQKRVKRFLKKLKQEHQSENNILIVAHSGTIQMILALIKGVHPQKIFEDENVQIEHTEVYQVKTKQQKDTFRVPFL